jgi:threonine synthase
MSYMQNLRCLSCQQTVETSPFRYFCPECGGYLDVEYDYEAMLADLSRDEFDTRRGTILEQWLEFLPIERPDLIPRATLGEVPTPMLQAGRLPPPADGAQIWLKNDAMLPTGSLKDRSMPLVILKALELDRSAVGIVSSGNASASLAAYGAHAGLRAVVFLGQNVPPGKLYKTMIHRPAGVQVMGPYTVAEGVFQQVRDAFGFFDCNGLVNPYRIEGKKTFAYETARDLGWRSPDVVFMPTGYGNGIVAAWKGFRELQHLGFVDSLPAMVAVQPAVCAPIAKAFEQGESEVAPVPVTESIAEAVCINDPLIGGKRVLEVVRESGGSVIGAEEAEIAEAVRILAEREGLAMEPTGAIALAGALKLMREGNPWADGIQVVSLTGIGLNDLQRGRALVGAPAQVEPRFESAEQALQKLLAD